ncbi:MAG TPA: formylmethanofuran dehydrogenase subunit B [Planctomycetaceae bacterium]|nr:formylmethanofuran dehydrogenase subunit B [Planctomycetaceae bacterium]
MPIIEDFACALCSCVCDDLRVTVRNGRIVRAENACALAEPWLLGQDSAKPPSAEIDGRSVEFDEAVARAAELLADARFPLIHGLSRSSTEGQRAAVSLAERIGATIDTTASRGHGPSVMSVQQVGESTCTLGEVKNRCDLVIFWGCNPVESHPRHLERYAADCAGLFTPRGRRDRTLVTVDVQPTATSEVSDLFIPIESGQDFEVFWALRALVRGLPLESKSIGRVPREVIEGLYQRMIGCRSGIVFFGFGLARRPGAHLAIEGLMQLVTELNARTRFYVRRLRGSGDVTGADNVLAWQTGYPFSVNLSRGYPRYNPGEFSANDLLERGEPDVCLFVGSFGAARFTPEARAHLERVPTIVLDPPTGRGEMAGTVRFTTSVYGIHQPGTAYRMDEVPIPLRAALPAVYPTDADVLQAIERRIVTRTQSDEPRPRAKKTGRPRRRQ